MKDRVCQDDCEAYRLFGTPDELMLEGMVEDLKLQYWAHDCPEEMVDEYNEYREWSLGIAAWKIIGFVLGRGWPIPPEVFPYLQQSAESIDDWAVQNRHPGELKNILKLHGKRKLVNEQSDPRWIYGAICQLRKLEPKATIKSLVQKCMKQFPHVGQEEEYVRQKYYQGKRLAEKGTDYKGRDRKRDVQTTPMLAFGDEDELDF